MRAFLRRLFGSGSKTPPTGPRTLQLGGCLFDATDWPDHVYEQLGAIRSVVPGSQYLVRATISAICPAKHTTAENVGLVAESAEVAKALAGGLPAARRVLTCLECGRPAAVSGEHIYWMGPLAEWDGVR